MRPTGNWSPALALLETAFLADFPFPRPDMVAQACLRVGNGVPSRWTQTQKMQLLEQMRADRNGMHCKVFFGQSQDSWSKRSSWGGSSLAGSQLRFDLNILLTESFSTICSSTASLVPCRTALANLAVSTQQPWHPRPRRSLPRRWPRRSQEARERRARARSSPSRSTSTRS